MQTLKDKVGFYAALAEKIVDETPGVMEIWVEIEDVPIEELREAQTESNKMYFQDVSKRMVLQQPYGWRRGLTMFAKSKEVKVKEHIVVEEAYINK